MKQVTSVMLLLHGMGCVGGGSSGGLLLMENKQTFEARWIFFLFVGLFVFEACSECTVSFIT